MTAEDGHDLDAQWLTFMLYGRVGVADGVDDRDGGEQAGDDRQADRPSSSDGCDEGEGEHGSADRAEVVHGAFEPVGAAVSLGGTTSATSALRAGTRSPRAVHARARRIATCQAAVAAPMPAERTVVVVYPPPAMVRRREGSSARAPPPKRATPASASERLR